MFSIMNGCYNETKSCLKEHFTFMHPQDIFNFHIGLERGFRKGAYPIFGKIYTSSL